MKVFITEKPSQMRDLAKALGGGRSEGEAAIRTAKGVVVSAVGHICELADPADLDVELRSPWRLAPLPWVPKPPIPVRVQPKHQGRFREISRHLKGASGVVICTDAGREGEAIAREILDLANYRGPIERMWVTRLDDASVRKAMANLLPGSEKEPLYFASRARSQADLAFGLNFSRALTQLFAQRDEGFFSAGRVQTPTLAFIVRREREIQQFKPVDYFVLQATVKTGGGELALQHPFSSDTKPPLLTNKAEADRVAKAAVGACSTLAVRAEKQTVEPPPPFALSHLQQEANTRWGWTAKRTLDVAQSLYERRKCTSYPRTDCPFLDDAQKGEAAGAIADLQRMFPTVKLPTPIFRKAVFDTAKVGEHHGIIPIAPAPWSSMDDDERKLFSVIAARYLAAMMPAATFDVGTVEMDAAGVKWGARGRQLASAGWREAYAWTGVGIGGAGQGELPNVVNGSQGTIEAVETKSEKTAPPKRYTEAELLAAMKGAARFVTDEKLKSILRGTEGLGTEATRAAVIETLKAREFIAPKGKSLIPSAKAMRFIQLVESNKHTAWLADPGETAVWEGALDRIARGELEENAFLSPLLQRFASSVRSLIDSVSRPARPDRTGGTNFSSTQVLCPLTRKPVLEDAGNFVFPGAAMRLPKVLHGRVMTAADYASVLSSKEPVRFEGFSAGGRAGIAATLLWNGTRLVLGRADQPVEEEAASVL